jgi:hypothetical protein
VGGDFQNDVRVALDHRGLFLAGMCGGSQRVRASGAGRAAREG